MFLTFPCRARSSLLLLTGESGERASGISVFQCWRHKSHSFRKQCDGAQSTRVSIFPEGDKRYLWFSCCLKYPTPLEREYSLLSVSLNCFLCLRTTVLNVGVFHENPAQRKEAAPIFVLVLEHEIWDYWYPLASRVLFLFDAQLACAMMNLMYSLMNSLYLLWCWPIRISFFNVIFLQHEAKIFIYFFQCLISYSLLWHVQDFLDVVPIAITVFRVWACYCKPYDIRGIFMPIFGAIYLGIDSGVEFYS